MTRKNSIPHLKLSMLLLISTLASVPSLYTHTPYPAVICVPVADLVNQPLPSHNGSSQHAYEHLPYDQPNCPRLQQLLYHDQVMVIDTIGDQVKVTIPMFFYITNQNKKPHTTYWTHRANIQPYAKSLTPYIPEPISFTTNHVPQKNIITLKEPHYDTKTRHTFSAGTRFIKATPKKHSPYTISVWIVHKTHSTTIKLPRKKCITYAHTHDKQIEQFVACARSWAQQAIPIPYVWGGSSIGAPSATTKSGVDCAGLIARAAQTCGLPYFFKNTTTLATYLRPLGKNEPLVNGDLIWIPGHVMLVADTKRNTVIEARTQSHGYGYVHEIPLSQVFKDIHTYNDLCSACATQKPLFRLDKNRTIISTIKNYKVLKVASIWEKNRHDYCQ